MDDLVSAIFFNNAMMCTASKNCYFYERVNLSLSDPVRWFNGKFDVVNESIMISSNCYGRTDACYDYDDVQTEISSEIYSCLD